MGTQKASFVKFAADLRKAVMDAGLTPTDAAYKTRIPYGTFNGYLAGTTMPNGVNLLRIEAVFPEVVDALRAVIRKEVGSSR